MHASQLSRWASWWLWLPVVVLSSPTLCGESFSWREAVNGSFDDPDRWQVGFLPPPRHNPGSKLPHGSDVVGFTRGAEIPRAYEVQITGGSVDWMMASAFNLPALTQPLTLRLSGTMTARRLDLGTRILLSGGGELAGGSESYLYDVSVLGGTTLNLDGGRASGILVDNAKGMFRGTLLEAPIAGDAIVVRGSEIQSSGKVRVGRWARLELGSKWLHQGGDAIEGAFWLKDGSAFSASDTVNLSATLLEGGSSFGAQNIEYLGFGGFTLKEASSIRAGYLKVNANSVEIFPSEVTGASTIDANIFELAQGFLKLASGSKLKTSTSSLGTSGSAGITVTGSGSEWSEQDHLAGGRVRVMDSGLVTFGSTAQDVFARVEGAGSKLQFKRLYAKSSLLVSGGALSTGEDFTVSQGGGGVEGKGSTLRLKGAFALGLESQGLSSFGIADGGLVECDTARLSSGAGQSTSMSVSGSGSSWRIDEELLLGKESDAKATLEIDQGGKVTVGTDFVPNQKTVSIGGGSAVRVAGDASVFDTSFVGTTVVGAEPSLARGRALLAVSGGASARVNRLEIAPDSVSDALVSVNGANSQINATTAVVIGMDGGKGAMEVRNGGKVSAESVEVGNSGKDNTLLITESGSSLSVRDGVFIGDDFARGTMTVANGARVSGKEQSPVRSLGVAVGEFSEGTLIVDGQGTTVDFPDDRLTVGFQGAGKMTVSRGAEVKVEECVIGYAAGSSGTLLVTGTELANQLSSLFVFEKLDVGAQRDPVPASLDVVTGGRVSVGEQMRVGPKGVVRLNGGGIVVGSGAAPPEVLLVSSGGVLTLDFGAKLILGSGRLVVRGGEYFPWGPVANSGAPEPGSPALQGATTARPGRRMAAAAAVTGSTQIEGGFSVETGGSMRMILAAAPGPQGPGPVRITGPVSIGGKLVIECVDGFAPSAGQRFEFLASGSGIFGDFAEIEVRGLSPSFRYELKADAAGVYAFTALSNGEAISRPRLTYQRAGGQLTLSWPASVAGFVLQQATDPDSATWRTVPSDANRATVPLTSPAGFFRLAKP